MKKNDSNQTFGYNSTAKKGGAGADEWGTSAADAWDEDLDLSANRGG